MIHWTTDYDAFGYHRAKCGIKVTTNEVESQRFEGVFRFYNTAYAALTQKKVICPDKYCKECWSKAISQAQIELRKLKK